MVKRGIIVLLSLLGAALCRPSVVTTFGNFSTDPLSPEDYEWLARHTPTHRVTYPEGFQFMYVAHDGHIVENHKPSWGYYIEVVGSPATPHSALYTAAQEVGKVLRHSPAHIFNNMADRHGAGAGVFTAQEKLVVFPEYYNLRNTPECYGRCDGACRHTCTFDGRKYENLAGVSGTRAIVLIDNVLCTSLDPYHHHDNILVHEFAHTVHHVSLTLTEKAQLTEAYSHAKANHLWRTGSYAMANNEEYFAEATGAFFLVNLQSSSGGMTNCPGGHKCRTEAEARAFLHDHDIQLFTLLSNVYTNGHPDIHSGLKVCDTASG